LKFQTQHNIPSIPAEGIRHVTEDAVSMGQIQKIKADHRMEALVDKKWADVTPHESAS